MEIWFFIVIIAIFLYYAENDAEKESPISIEDILVGDIVSIKGERFEVVAYSEKGVMEITNGTENYYIKLSEKDIKFVLHCTDSKRKYIEIKGIKGTVKGDYLNKIKF